jgi:hypothetical protein
MLIGIEELHKMDGNNLMKTSYATEHKSMDYLFGIRNMITKSNH